MIDSNPTDENKQLQKELHQRTEYYPAHPGMVFIPEGWTGLVTELHENLLKVDPSYQVQQVKEKFGGLRFYAITTEEGNKLIRDAEDSSYSICIVCSEPGKTREPKWYLVLCDECVKDYSPWK